MVRKSTCNTYGGGEKKLKTEKTRKDNLDNINNQNYRPRNIGANKKKINMGDENIHTTMMMDDGESAAAVVATTETTMMMMDHEENTSMDHIDDDENKYDPKIVSEMLQACEVNDMNTIQRLVEATTTGDNNNNACTTITVYGYQQDPNTGTSPLMVAAKYGYQDMVLYLLQIGKAPWNAIDQYGYCAGDYATQNEHWELVQMLVDWGTKSEFILGRIERTIRQQHEQETKIERTTSSQNQQVSDNNNDDDDAQQVLPVEMLPCTKPDYLRQRLLYTKDGKSLLDADQDAVMMEWERPLMALHAQVLMDTSVSQEPESVEIVLQQQQKKKKSVLNIGFGMGIIDTILSEQYEPSLHVIIEAHPDVYQKMIQDGWCTNTSDTNSSTGTSGNGTGKKANVVVLFGTWQTVLPIYMKQNPHIRFDAIFYDTYGEHFLDFEDFHTNMMVPLLAQPYGIYSFFNGLTPDNLFFHGVACNCIQIQLQQYGINSEFISCDIEVPNNDVWDGIRRKYWHNRSTYYLPKCTWNMEYLQQQQQTNGTTQLVLPPTAEDIPIIMKQKATTELNRNDNSSLYNEFEKRPRIE